MSNLWNPALNVHDVDTIPVKVSPKVKQELADSGNPNKYFHILLNMADDDLDPYQYRLLGHYRRVCGESGACWESTRTTAKICKMSAGKVSSTRRELAECGYLNIEYRGDETCRITLIDRMSENIERYSKRSPDEHVHSMNASVHEVNNPVHEVKQRRTTVRRTKEEDKSIAPDSADDPKPPKPKPPTEHQLMSDAIVQAFGWSWDTMTPTNKTHVGKVARELRGAKATPNHVSGLYAYCDEQFDGITPAVLSKHWAAYVKDVLGGKVDAPDDPPPQVTHTREALGLPPMPDVDYVAIANMTPEQRQQQIDALLDELDRTKGLSYVSQ